MTKQELKDRILKLRKMVYGVQEISYRFATESADQRDLHDQRGERWEGATFDDVSREAENIAKQLFHSVERLTRLERSVHFQLRDDEQ